MSVFKSPFNDVRQAQTVPSISLYAEYQFLLSLEPKIDKLSENTRLRLMSSTLDSLLNLPGVTIEGSVQVEGYVCLQVKILAPGINCPHCPHPTQELHQSSSILIRDLPTNGSPVYLKVPSRKFYCRKCQRYSTEKLGFVDWRRSHTQRYESNIYERVQSSSIEQISREEKLSSSEVQGIENHVTNQLKKKTGCRYSA